MAFLAFEGFVNFEGSLGEQKQTAEEKNQIAPRNLLAQDSEERGRQCDNPRQRKQQNNPHYQRQTQTKIARAVLLPRGQFPCEDRNKYDIVDTEDDFQSDQSYESDPCLWVDEPVHRFTS